MQKVQFHGEIFEKKILLNLVPYYVPKIPTYAHVEKENEMLEFKKWVRSRERRGLGLEVTDYIGSSNLKPIVAKWSSSSSLHTVPSLTTLPTCDNTF